MKESQDHTGEDWQEGFCLQETEAKPKLNQASTTERRVRKGFNTRALSELSSAPPLHLGQAAPRPAEPQCVQADWIPKDSVQGQELVFSAFQGSS